MRMKIIATLAAAIATSAAAELTTADAQYYADFAAAAKRIGKQLDKLADLIAATSSGKNYAADCEDRAREFADAYHFLEERVPPAEAVTPHKDLMASAEFGAQAASELGTYYDAEFRHKEKVTKVLDLYEKAVTKYADALAATPLPEKD